jgi:phospholipid/cholesterol/gamma-HCH transport system substrate-binding protein
MKKYSMETTVGLFMAVGLALVIYMAINLGNVSFFGNDNYLLYARFNSIAGLHVDNSVDLLGMQIGRITGLQINQDRLQAVVEMSIRKDIKIYSDAIASIKTEGLIGEKYVSIDPGGGGMLLKPGDMIIETVPPIDLWELIGKYAFGSVEGKESGSGISSLTAPTGNGGVGK